MRNRVALAFENIHLKYGGNSVLSGATATLHRGERVLLQGENGSGKTSLINILSCMADGTSGRVEICGADGKLAWAFPRPWWQRLAGLPAVRTEKLASNGVRRSWQQVRFFGSMSLRDHLMLALGDGRAESPWAPFAARHAMLKQELQARDEADEVLTTLGLGEQAGDTPAVLSIADARLLALRCVLHGSPRVALLDEPLNALDETSRVAVMELLSKTAKERGTSFIIVEHDLNIPQLLPFITTVWTLDRGKIAVQPVSQAGTRPLPLASKSLPQWLEVLVGPRPRVEAQRLSMGGCFYRITPTNREPGKTLIRVKNLRPPYGCLAPCPATGTADDVPCPATGTADDGLSFELGQGQLGILASANGWGKTAVLKSIAGLVPALGEIYLNETALECRQTWERAALGLATLQSDSDGFPGLKVRETLRVFGISDHVLPIGKLLDLRTENLSGGERRLVGLECTLRAGRFSVALLDEPFQSLDSFATRHACEYLSRLLETRTAIMALPKSSVTSTLDVLAAETGEVQ